MNFARSMISEGIVSPSGLCIIKHIVFLSFCYGIRIGFLETTLLPDYCQELLLYFFLRVKTGYPPLCTNYRIR